MSCKRAIICMAAVAVSLGACTTAPIGSADPYLGEAVKYNAAVQIINPDPVYAGDAAKPGASGDKGAQAVKRYRTDKVKSVEVMETSSGAGGGSPK